VALPTVLLALAGCALAPAGPGTAGPAAVAEPPPSTAAASTPPGPGSLATPSLQERYAALRAGDGQVYQIEPAQSQLRIYAFRAGSARQFGHNHVLSAPQFTGYAFVARSPAAAQPSRFDLEFALDALLLDLPEHRSNLGEAFASVLTPAQIAATRENMLGRFGLQAAQYPVVRIRSLQLQGETPKLVAQLAITLHGQERQMQVPLQVQTSAQSLQVQGSLVLLQTDFGIKPYSVLGGLLAVQDAVLVEFKLQGTALPP